MSYNGPKPTSSGKDKVGKVCLTTGHHGPVVARIRSENMSHRKIVFSYLIITTTGR
jgi:hypothetical protein